MRTVANTLGFLAIVNLLALVIFAGWLWKSGRLDRGRVQEVRRLLATPIAEAAATEAEAEARAEAVAAATADAARRADPPLDSTAQNRRSAQVLRHEALLRRRLEDERRLLLAGLEARTQELESRRSQLAASEQEQASRESEDRDAQARAQFAKAVQQLESVPAKQAKAILVTLVESEGRERAVAYLDAMQPRASAKVLREFKTEAEIRLATELLEALRTWGLDPSGPGTARQESGDDGTPSDADAD